MPNQPKTVARTIRVDEELWAAVTAEAERRGETVSEAVRRMLRGYTAAFTESGSIEGRLEGMTCFRVYDALTGQGIRCDFGTRIALDNIKNAIGKRVAIYGVISYAYDGNPTECKAEELTVFPADSDLPDFRSLRGILR